MNNSLMFIFGGIAVILDIVNMAFERNKRNLAGVIYWGFILIALIIAMK